MSATTIHPMRNTLIRAFHAARVQRFAIDIVRPDGSTEHIERIGGSSIDHCTDGMERAGIGGVVRVRLLDMASAS